MVSQMDTYKPDQPVTRGQMAIFLNRAFTLTTGQANSFKDVSSNMAAYQSILNVSARWNCKWLFRWNLSS